MTVILGAVIAMLCIIVIAIPFAQKNHRLHGHDADERDIEQSHDRLLIYEEISNLRREHDLGEIADLEYHDRLHSLRFQAATLLRDQIEHQQSIDTLDKHIEEQIRQVRTKLGDQEGITCPNCSHVASNPTDTCTECGAPITTEDSGG